MPAQFPKVNLFIKAVAKRLSVRIARELMATPPEDAPALIIQNITTRATEETKPDNYNVEGTITITDAKKYNSDTEYPGIIADLKKIIDTLHGQQDGLNEDQSDLNLDYIRFQNYNHSLESYEGGSEYSLTDITFSFKILN